MQLISRFTLQAFLVLIHISPQVVLGQGEFFSKNLNHYYDLDAELRLFHKVVNYQDKTFLFIKLTLNQDRTQIDDLITTYGFINNYEENLVLSEDTIDLRAYWINNIGNEHFLSFEIENSDGKKILIIKIHNQLTGNDFYFDMNVDPAAKFANSGIVLKIPGKSLPFFRNYIWENEDFELANLKTEDSTIHVFRYSSSFDIADPPFSSSSSSVIKSIEIDSSFSVASRRDTVKLLNLALYFAQYDTTGVNGLAFRVESKHYPKLATYEELIESLTYFTTKSEFVKLTSATDKKKAFDEYWLEITKSSERARRIIREYYRRISLANDTFTTYKQGWKTDKGMIFVVFGPPDEVFRNGEREEWVFQRTNQLPRIDFTFVKAKSIFTDDHYVLLRRKSYQQIWYKAIDLWRKGQKEL